MFWITGIGTVRQTHSGGPYTLCFSCPSTIKKVGLMLVNFHAITVNNQIKLHLPDETFAKGMLTMVPGLEGTQTHKKLTRYVTLVEFPPVRLLSPLYIYLFLFLLLLSPFRLGTLS